METLKIVPFKPNEAGEYDKAEVIRKLEQSIEYAREGKPLSVAVVMICDGEVLDCWHNGGQPYVMLGALESLKLDFTTACIERR